jgi:chloride channel protein, CIC family
LHTIWPEATAGSGAYALVGIGGVVGGTAMAPLTAIILLFEMTDDYRIILPVMVVTALSVVVTRTLVGESIYTLKLRRQNIGYYAAAEIERIHGTTVATAMRADVPIVSASMSVVGGLAAAVQARATALPVGNENGDVVGAVTVTQLAGAAVLDERPASLAELAVDVSRVRIARDARLDAALARLADGEHDVLVVTEEADGPARLSGILTRHDALRAYERVIRSGRS